MCNSKPYRSSNLFSALLSGVSSKCSKLSNLRFVHSPSDSILTEAIGSLLLSGEAKGLLLVMGLVNWPGNR
jgi:hypothetical protein